MRVSSYVNAPIVCTDLGDTTVHKFEDGTIKWRQQVFTYEKVGQTPHYP